MCGKALPIGTDWGSFSVEKSATFQQFREENKKEAWKSAFLPENCVENPGKTVE